MNDLQLARLIEEKADVLAFEVIRVDETNHPHFLYHAGLPGFFEWLASRSVRREERTVLSMFGTGSFWTREAFTAVARWEEPFPIYLEIYLPTLAHHLGFRVRAWKEQGRFISSLGDYGDRLEEARAAGLWTAHPAKKLWL